MEEPGERAQRRRQLILLLALALLLLLQWVALDASRRAAVGEARAVDIAQIFAPLLVTFGILRGFFGAPMWIAREAKLAANDELAADNRRRALSFGMVIAVCAAAIACAVLPFYPLDGIMVAHGLLAAFLIPAVCRFVWLER